MAPAYRAERRIFQGRGIIKGGIDAKTELVPSLIVLF